MEFEAFDGRVVFTLGSRSLRSLIVREGLENAVPEHATFKAGGQASILFNNLVTFLSDTREIAFPNLNGASADENELAALREFWSFAQESTDYRAIWERYQERVTLDVHNAWIEAVNRRIDPRLQAPPDVQHGAPSDAELEAAGEKKD